MFNDTYVYKIADYYLPTYNNIMSLVMFLVEVFDNFTKLKIDSYKF